MLMVIPNICDGCKKEKKALPFELTWRYKRDKCGLCGHDDSRYVHFRTCSSKCLKTLVDRLKGHKHKWTADPIRTGLMKGKEEKMLLTCEICKIYEWRKPSKKILAAYKKEYKDYFNITEDEKIRTKPRQRKNPKR